ncbi:CCA tRNA nucleotidyltransferase [Sporomusa malonica]|uniref:tRNA nucleotidyltransferase/poly(A) polymerase n=2 Tax=Sporomusa malonica TaxID=112901 RepID=A0A1W2CPJ1_9FIRM|nr:tRNA nucleotidyltransferase/poly(A) polymerase [Sporomusa malonica]
MESAGQIMAALAAAGHEAYIVGGAVRDIMRGAQPVDIDIATSAIPDEIVMIASRRGWKAITIGAAFGVVAVVADGRNYEIATFRSERYGADSHRPEAVRLGVSLREDLARRDFTINAMAMDADGRVIDLFGGQQDLAARLIRAVGNPHERFAEDGLRMFRAARFAARFGFTLENGTLDAISANLGRINGLSVERVQAEIGKTLMADFASQGLAILLQAGLLGATCQAKEQGQAHAVPILPELAHLNGLSQNPKYHLHDAWQHTLAAVDLTPPTAVLRWAALLHDVAKGWPGVRTINREGQPSDPGHDKAGAEAAAAILGRLRVERQVLEQVVWLIRHHLVFPPAECKTVLKWLKRLAGGFKSSSQFGAALEQLFALHQADRLAGHTQPDIDGLEAVQSIASSILMEIPFFPAQLKLRGQEISSKIGGGLEVGRFQQNLLARIQAGQLSNTHAALVAALDARARRMLLKQQDCF